MARGRTSALAIRLTTQHRAALARTVRLAPRALTVLLRAEGVSLADISRATGLSRETAYKWLYRYQTHGVLGLEDRPRKRAQSRGRRTRVDVHTTAAERTALRRLVHDGGPHAHRAQAVLLRLEGASITAIARRVGVSRRHVYKWIYRFQRDGLAGLDSLPTGRRTRGVGDMDDKQEER